ncbi:MAG: N-acetylmuramic acid 6-phosphate etherase, partial [Betaproteobacteria bacterium]|nr:N-acetylmuramic acid 6-phosphate etherase [Betaproteobacteria bacterium]
AEVGAARIALSCNRGAAMSRHAQVGIEVDTGPEAVMGSTRMKAGTAQKLVMNMISTAVMIRLGRTFDNLMIKLNCKNEKGRNRAARLFLEATGKGDVAYAKRALGHAGGSLEIAVLMEKTCATDAQAREALAASDGHFQKALDWLSERLPAML